MIPLSLIEKLPFVGSVVSFIKDKGRLAIEYALIALVIAMSAYSLSAYIKTAKLERALTASAAKLDSTKNELMLQEIITQDQRNVISELNTIRKNDAIAFVGLLKDFRAISLKDAASKKKLETLELQNENVRKYLDGDIPSELECLLTPSCKSSNPNSN